MSLSYNTAYNAIETMRYSILAHAEDASDLLGGEIELDESYFGGRRKGNRGRGALVKSLFSVFLKDRGRFELLLFQMLLLKLL